MTNENKYIEVKYISKSHPSCWTVVSVRRFNKAVKNGEVMENTTAYWRTLKFNTDDQWEIYNQ